MKTKTVKTWTAHIYCGLRHGYSEAYASEAELKQVCQDFCDKVGFCVSFTPTTYVYSKGQERGLIVGVIRNPRFDKTDAELKDQTLILANLLKFHAKQLRLSVVFQDETQLLGETE